MIKLKIKKEKKHVILSIKDNGIGISKEEQLKLFSRFFRGQGASSHDPDGEGLGLSIVQKIVNSHKGSIEVKSELKKGAEFLVKLPLLD